MASHTSSPTDAGTLMSDLTVERLQQYQLRQTLVASLHGTSPLDPQLITYTDEDSVPVRWSHLPRPAIGCAIRTALGVYVPIMIETYFASMDHEVEGVISNFLYPMTAEDLYGDQYPQLNKIHGLDLPAETWDRMATHVVFEIRNAEVWLKLLTSEIIDDPA
jgi:hypothetical protein